MIILGIETSCDETSVGIVEKKGNKLQLKANVVVSSLELHSKTGGIIPEIAAREQVKYMLPVLEQALKEGINSKFQAPPIDAIAVTYGPGLIGSLLVGLETAKTLSYIWNKPLIPVNHMLGHIYANWLTNETMQIKFPALVLVVSGGHTDLILLKNHGELRVIGATRDDAAGEAFDKIARLLNLAYPGGPAIQKAALAGNAKAIHFPRPLLGENTYDFSFSGLKTAVFREVQKLSDKDKQLKINDIAASAQMAIIDVLVKKTIRAAKQFEVKSTLLSGGVAANDLLRETIQSELHNQKLDIEFKAPDKNLCTDNGAMIAAAAAFNYQPVPWQEIIVNPELYY